MCWVGILLGTGERAAGLTWDAAKLGELVLVGGLAYKAYQNYRTGKPALDVGGTHQQFFFRRHQARASRPTDSRQRRRLSWYLRAMIAAAAADGTIDADEQQEDPRRLAAGAAWTGAAQQFLAREIDNPATVDDLADCRAPRRRRPCRSIRRPALPSIPTREEEHEFLVALAERLGIDDDLAAHIDATARSAGT